MWLGAWAQLFVFINAVRLYIDGQWVYAGPVEDGVGGFSSRCGLSHFFLMPLLAPTAVSIAHIVSVGKRHLYDVMFEEEWNKYEAKWDWESFDADIYDKVNRAVLTIPIICVVGYIFLFWAASFMLFLYVTAIGLFPTVGIAVVLVILFLLGGR